MPGHEITTLCLPGGQLIEQEETLVEEETQAMDSVQIFEQNEFISILECMDYDILKTNQI